MVRVDHGPDSRAMFIFIGTVRFLNVTVHSKIGWIVHVMFLLPAGGTLADSIMEARRKSLRPSRSEVPFASQPHDKVFKAPRSALGETFCSSSTLDSVMANETFKVPNSRRESTSSVRSNQSDVSTTSRSNVPNGAGRLFSCEDEDGEQFSSAYLNELKQGWRLISFFLLCFLN